MSDAPFSESREWFYCAFCQEHGQWLLSDEDDLADCPECGQPPRCMVGRALHTYCDRVATVSPFGMSAGVCGQHYLSHDLLAEGEQYEWAQTWISLFTTQAKEIGCAALMEALDLAGEYCEMRVASLRAEESMVWHGS